VLGCEHRITDGADAARFVATVEERLEEGAFAPDLGISSRDSREG
jgi:pyruvate dehydrogenase E2 component (dihydrolipoamide acetyltransferase)